MPVKVHSSPDRKYAVWAGGSVLASLKSFREAWIYKGKKHMNMKK